MSALATAAPVDTDLVDTDLVADRSGRRPASSVDEELAEAIWRRSRRLPNADWASSPEMQQKVRGLFEGHRPALRSVPTSTHGRFEAGNRIVVVGRRTQRATAA